jgi:hypothetical protein
MKSLLELFPQFHGMFFASTTVVPASGGDTGGGGGAGEEGAGGGAGGGGGYEAPGTPTEVVPPGGEEGAPGPTGEEGAGARQGVDERGQRPGDVDEKDVRAAKPGPVLPKDIQRALSAIRANAETSNAARALNDAYYRMQATYGDKGLFKDFEEAKSSRATLLAVGGPDGIAEMQSKVETLVKIDDEIDRGDPNIIKDMAQSAPNGFKRLVGPALDELQRMDNSAYSDVIKSHLFYALEGAGFGETINATLEALTAGEQDKAKRNLTDLARWYAGQRENIERSKTARPDPRLAEFDEREKKLRSDEEAAFQRNVKTDLVSYMNSALENELSTLMSGYALREETKRDLAQSIYDEITRTMQGDKNYQQHANALLRGRDHHRILEFMQSKVDIITPQAARAVWNRRYGDVQPPRTKPRTQAAPATVTPPAGTPGSTPAAVRAIMLPERPHRDLIDWSKDPTSMLFITGKGYMLGGPHKGKLVQWKK